MNLKGILVGLFLAIRLALFAHPSWGIVVNDDGAIYFVDVTHNHDGTLWKIDAQHESIEAIQKGFHAHHIEEGQQGNLWVAIAIWRQGEIEGEGHNFLFEFDPSTNQLDTLLFTDDWDHFHGSVFTVDQSGGAVFFAKNGYVFKNDLNGQVEKLLDHKFNRLSTLTTTPDGNIWITDSREKRGTLYYWNDREGLRVAAQNLFPENPENPIFDDTRWQLIYGIGFSESGHPLITENVGRKLLEIQPDGTAISRYKSEVNWHPIGIRYHDRHYYVMESGWSNGAIGPRFTILTKDFTPFKRLTIDFNQLIVSSHLLDSEMNQIPVPKKVPLFPYPLIIGVLFLIIISFWVFKRSRRHQIQ